MARSKTRYPRFNTPTPDRTEIPFQPEAPSHAPRPLPLPLGLLWAWPSKAFPALRPAGLKTFKRYVEAHCRVHEHKTSAIRIGFWHIQPLFSVVQCKLNLRPYEHSSKRYLRGLRYVCRYRRTAKEIDTSEKEFQEKTLLRSFSSSSASAGSPAGLADFEDSSWLARLADWTFWDV